MKRIPELYWNNNNVQHLFAAHQVTPDEIEEIIFGCDGDGPTYHINKDGDFYVISGQTGGGRLLKIVGEFLEGRRFRVFAARDMKPNEARAYRNPPCQHKVRPTHGYLSEGEKRFHCAIRLTDFSHSRP